MDIHRCRFVPFKAAAINAVAFSHPHLSTGNKHNKTAPARLAIGRANGDIEIWNPLQGTWLHETTLPGGHDRSVEGLAWVVGDDEELPPGDASGRPAVSHGRLRLFSIGYTNTITEWDLERGCARRHASGQHGELWCLAAQPKGELGAGAGAGGAAASVAAAADATNHQRLVGGTMDGCLALYSTEDDDLRFQRLLRTPKKTVKMVSLAFQSRHLAVAGCSDGTIRVFDLRRGALLHTMTMGRDLAAAAAGATGAAAKDVIVWCVRCLPSGDIVSGDSTGQICIWDGATYTQAQRIQSHTQDVLSLATSADGAAIVSGGMDRRVVLYREMAGRAARWARVWHRRYHQHDVKALAAFEARGLSVVVAGGPDAAPVVLPLHKSGLEHHRTLSHLPQAVPVASAPAARLVAAWWERRVEIWSLPAPIDALLRETAAAATTTAATDADLLLARNRRLVGRILLQGDGHITAAAISADGTLLVAATATEVKAFQLVPPPPSGSSPGQLVIAKVPVPAAVAAQGASSVAIAPNGRWVALARGVDNHVTVLEVVRPAAAAKGAVARLSFRARPARLARLRRAVPRYELFSGLGRYDRRIVQMAFAPDSRLLAAGDLAGYLDTWVLRGPAGVPEDAAGGGDGEGGEEEEEDGMVDAPAAGSDEEDSSDSEDEDKAGEAEDTAAADRWVPNPRAKQLPKLSAAPVVLSFSSDVPGGPASAGAAADDSNATTARDYVLLVATAASRLFAFHPLRARLVPWQRRLTPANLPAEYRDIREVAKGALWQGPRMWLYGATFLFMVDTAVEPDAHPQPQPQPPRPKQDSGAAAAAVPRRKRKRGDDSGAGSRMPGPESLAPQRVQMAVGGGTDGSSAWVDVDMEDVRKSGLGSGGDDDDDDDDETDSEAEMPSQPVVSQQQPPAKSPRKQQRKQKQKRGGRAQEQDREQEQDDSDRALATAQPQQPRSWHTFKYRPILGIVPLLSSPSAAAAASSSVYPPLEVALIERPGWDMDLPERYGDDR